MIHRNHFFGLAFMKASLLYTAHTLFTFPLILCGIEESVHKVFTVYPCLVPVWAASICLVSLKYVGEFTVYIHLASTSTVI